MRECDGAMKRQGMWRSDISLKTLKEDAGFDRKSERMREPTFPTGSCGNYFLKLNAYMPIVTYKIGLFMMRMGPWASDLYKF